MGRVVSMNGRSRVRRRPIPQPDWQEPVEPPAPTRSFRMRWGWTLSIWVNIYMVYTAAVSENLMWCVIHGAFCWWAIGVRRNNDAQTGGKNW